MALSDEQGERAKEAAERERTKAALKPGDPHPGDPNQVWDGTKYVSKASYNASQNSQKAAGALNSASETLSRGLQSAAGGLSSAIGTMRGHYKAKLI